LRADRSALLALLETSVMYSITIISRAKVNLTLEVLGRRADGYHDLDSVARIIDLTDELSIAKADEGVIEIGSDTQGVPSGPDNLVHKACRAFFVATGIRAGARCNLVKRIPARAGLGGGSGNAAAAIAALNDLYECGLPVDRLAEIAGRVGSDVGLFVYGGTVRMRGRGERVEALPDAPEMHLVVVKPEVGVSTAWAYRELDRSPGRSQRGASDAAERAVRAGDRAGLIASMWNDFDPMVAAAFDEIASAKRSLLDHGAQAALLAGSGSAVFGVFATKEAAESVADSIRREFGNVLVTRTLPRRQPVSSPGGED